MYMSEQPPGQTLLQGAPHGDEVEEVCGVVLVLIIIIIVRVIIIIVIIMVIIISLLTSMM